MYTIVEQVRSVGEEARGIFGHGGWDILEFEFRKA